MQARHETTPLGDLPALALVDVEPGDADESIFALEETNPTLVHTRCPVASHRMPGRVLELAAKRGETVVEILAQLAELLHVAHGTTIRRQRSAGGRLAEAGRPVKRPVNLVERLINVRSA